MNYSELDKLSLKDLEALKCEIEASIERRVSLERKEQWVDRTYCAYLAHPNATLKKIGNKRLIVAVYDRNKGVSIGASKPHRFDSYDSKTGTAVAFAKAMDFPIPDYI